MHPRLVLLDEPSQGLAPRIVEEIAAVMQEMRREGIAMAHWGIAMSLWYPLWQPPDAATLKKGWVAVEQAKTLGASTERERDYIAAIEAFYKESDKLDHRTRGLAYEKAMERLYVRYSQDREAAVFYALALN